MSTPRKKAISSADPRFDIRAWPGIEGGQPIAAEDAVHLADDLSVLADPVRVRIISLLAANEPRPTTVTELVSKLDRTQPTISHHLRVLLAAGFCTREQSGTWSLYRVRPRRFRELAKSISPKN